jgi:hypothetical protein
MRVALRVLLTGYDYLVLYPGLAGDTVPDMDAAGVDNLPAPARAS